MAASAESKRPIKYSIQKSLIKIQNSWNIDKWRYYDDEESSDEDWFE